MKFLLLVLFLSSCSYLPFDKIPKDTDKFRVAWVKNLDPVYSTGNLPIGTSSPFIYEGMVFMGDLKGYMSAYDLEDGTIKWQQNEKHPIQGKANVYKDHIYYGSINGRLFVRHFLTSKLKYAIDLGAPIESQPIFTRGRVIIHLRNHTVVCLDAQTGKVFWRYQRSIPYTTTLQRVSHALPVKNQLVVGFADGYLVSLSLEEGVLNWEQKISTGVKFIDVDVNPILFSNYIVAGSAAGPMRFVSSKNGVIERTLEINQSHTPLLVKEGMIVGGVYGEIYLIDRYGKIQKRKKLAKDGISSITPFKNGYMVSTMGSKVYHVNKSDFSVKSVFELGNDQSAVFGDLTSENGHLAIYSSRNRLYVLK